MYIEPEGLFKEYKKILVVDENKKITNFIFEHFTKIVGCIMIIIMFIAGEIKQPKTDLSIIFPVLMHTFLYLVLPIALGKAIKKYYENNILKKNPEYKSNINKKFKELMKKHNLDKDEDYLKWIIECMKNKKEKLKFVVPIAAAIEGIIIASVWAYVFELIPKKIDFVIVIIFMGILGAMGLVLLMQILIHTLEILLNGNYREYREFVEKLEIYYYYNKFKKNRNTIDVD